MTSLISVISCGLLLRWSQLFGGGIRGRWWSGGGDPVLLVSDNGGGGSICGVLRSRARSRSGVLSTASSFTMLSSSEDDSAKTNTGTLEYREIRQMYIFVSIFSYVGNTLNTIICRKILACAYPYTGLRCNPNYAQRTLYTFRNRVHVTKYSQPN